MDSFRKLTISMDFNRRSPHADNQRTKTKQKQAKSIVFERSFGWNGGPFHQKIINQMHHKNYQSCSKPWPGVDVGFRKISRICAGDHPKPKIQTGSVGGTEKQMNRNADSCDAFGNFGPTVIYFEGDGGFG